MIPETITLEYIEETEELVKKLMDYEGWSPYYGDARRLEYTTMLHSNVLYYLKLGKAGRELLTKKLTARIDELKAFVAGNKSEPAEENGHTT